jgi:hypothetical protein
MRDSQREAVLDFITPLLTALFSALLTSRTWAEILSAFFSSIA